jgi:hypothetical protein
MKTGQQKAFHAAKRYGAAIGAADLHIATARKA